MVEHLSNDGPRLIEPAELERRERANRRKTEREAYEHDKAVLAKLQQEGKPFEVVVQNVGRTKKDGKDGAPYGAFCRIPGTNGRDGLVHVSQVIGGRNFLDNVVNGETTMMVIISAPIKESVRRERPTFEIELSEKAASQADMGLEPGLILKGEVVGGRDAAKVEAGFFLLRTAEGLELLLSSEHLDGLNPDRLTGQARMQTRVCDHGRRVGRDGRRRSAEGRRLPERPRPDLRHPQGRAEALIRVSYRR